MIVNPQSVFDVPRLVREINNIRNPHEEEPLGAEDPIRKEPRDNPFLRKLNELLPIKKPGTTIKYSINQERPGILSGLVHYVKDVRIGYIFVEEGIYPRTSHIGEDEAYESLTFRLKDPITLRIGGELPTCTIQVHALINNGRLKESTIREDHHGLRRTDLSPIIPTEWFFKEGLYAPGSS